VSDDEYALCQFSSLLLVISTRTKQELHYLLSILCQTCLHNQGLQELWILNHMYFAFCPAHNLGETIYHDIQQHPMQSLQLLLVCLLERFLALFQPLFPTFFPTFFPTSLKGFSKELLIGP